MWSYFKYLNLFAFWDANNWISEYRNINFFEYPVNMKDLSCISSVLLIVVFRGIIESFYWAQAYHTIASPSFFEATDGNSLDRFVFFHTFEHAKIRKNYEIPNHQWP